MYNSHQHSKAAGYPCSELHRYPAADPIPKNTGTTKCLSQLRLYDADDQQYDHHDHNEA
jgi:hypothetical protein